MDYSCQCGRWQVSANKGVLGVGRSAGNGPYGGKGWCVMELDISRLKSGRLQQRGEHVREESGVACLQAAVGIAKLTFGRAERLRSQAYPRFDDSPTQAQPFLHIDTHLACLTHQTSPAAASPCHYFTRVRGCAVPTRYHNIFCALLTLQPRSSSHDTNITMTYSVPGP